MGIDTVTQLNEKAITLPLSVKRLSETVLATVPCGCTVA